MKKWGVMLVAGGIVALGIFTYFTVSSINKKEPPPVEFTPESDITTESATESMQPGIFGESMRYNETKADTTIVSARDYNTGYEFLTEYMSTQTELLTEGTANAEPAVTSGQSTGKSTAAAGKLPQVDITEELIYGLADEVLAKLEIGGLSAEGKVLKIYNWVKSNVIYISNSDKISVLDGAYNALKKKKGDCYTFYAISEVLLTRAGIENQMIRREGGRTNHFWNLIKINGQWYHFDTTPAKIARDTHMFTESQAVELTALRGGKYYVYDHSLYPEVTIGSPTPKAADIKDVPQELPEEINEELPEEESEVLPETDSFAVDDDEPSEVPESAEQPVTEPPADNIENPEETASAAPDAGNNELDDGETDAT